MHLKRKNQNTNQKNEYLRSLHASLSFNSTKIAICLFLKIELAYQMCLKMQ